MWRLKLNVPLQQAFYVTATLAIKVISRTKVISRFGDVREIPWKRANHGKGWTRRSVASAERK